MRTYALYNQSKRIMWFTIVCATILSGFACVGPVIDSAFRVLRKPPVVYFWYKDRDELHTLSITGRCYNAIPVNVYVYLAGSFSNLLK